MARPILFRPEQFTPTEFHSAADKAKFANHFVRFVESDFKATLFPKWFYRELSMTFGHIAHYNQGGFYGTFFNDLRGRLEFLAITAGEVGLYAESGMGICGDPTFTYSDVEKVLRAWVVEKDLVRAYMKKTQAAIEAGERSELARLSAKYEKKEAV